MIKIEFIDGSFETIEDADYFYKDEIFIVKYRESGLQIMYPVSFVKSIRYLSF